jgi:aminoglycoside phosphotransferase family enzyme
MSPPRCADEASLDEKVAFLSRPDSYGLPAGDVMRRETHMSWVFLAGNEAYKLKKPVRFPYLDFSTLSRREQACRAELALNRRLAPDVYKAVAPVVRTRRGLVIGGPACESGEVADWLVVMRRLDPGATLEHAIGTRSLAASQLDRLLSTLGAFYQHAAPVLVSPESHLLGWRRNLAFNRSILLDARLDLPAGLVCEVIRTQSRFLTERRALIAGRVRSRHIVDGHGDLRPEHIWLGDQVRVIDCLEFNASLRAVDPFDEIAFLCLECERLGCAWAAEYVRRRAYHVLPDGLSDELFAFYRAHRGIVRARLSAAHLLEPDPRTPGKWRQLARTYLRLALADARRLDRFLNMPSGRRRPARHEAGGSPPPAGGRPAGYRSCVAARQRRA